MGVDNCVFFFCKASALKCYECINGNEGCPDPFNKDKFTVKECSLIGAATGGNVCFKSKISCK